jgi:hypothetical protein
MKRFTEIKKSSVVKNTKVSKIFENISDEEVVAQNIVTKSEPAKFFSKLFEAREMAHIYHLQVRGDEGSHAAHKALEEYYDGVLDLMDDLIEVYQGQYDIVEGYDSIDTSTTGKTDPLEYFIELAEFIKTTRYSAILEEDAHLQAIIDEVLILVYKTVYKLKFTK